jgi:hypothetical protein
MKKQLVKYNLNDFLLIGLIWLATAGLAYLVYLKIGLLIHTRLW